MDQDPVKSSRDTPGRYHTVPSNEVHSTKPGMGTRACDDGGGEDVISSSSVSSAVRYSSSESDIHHVVSFYFDARESVRGKFSRFTTLRHGNVLFLVIGACHYMSVDVSSFHHV